MPSGPSLLPKTPIAARTAVGDVIQRARRHQQLRDVGLQLRVGGPVLGVVETAEQYGVVVDGDLLGAQVAVGDLVIVQDPQRPPDPRPPASSRWLRRAECRGRGCARTTSTRDRAASTASGEVLATPRSPMAIAISARCSTMRRIEAWNGAVSPPRRVNLRQSWRSAPPLRWFGLYNSISVVEPSAQSAASSSDPRPASRTTVSPVTVQPRRSIARTAPSSGTSSAGVPTTRITSAPTNHPTARPSSERAGTTALTTRWMGTKASSSAHHQCRHRAGSHGPGHREHRGEHRDPARVVEELRQEGLGLLADVEVPLRRRDAVGPDRQREQGDDAGRRVRAEQFPVPA